MFLYVCALTFGIFGNLLAVRVYDFELNSCVRCSMGRPKNTKEGLAEQCQYKDQSYKFIGCLCVAKSFGTFSNMNRR